MMRTNMTIARPRINNARALCLHVGERLSLRVGDVVRKAKAGAVVLLAVSAFAINRVFAFIEKKVQIPGFIVAGTGGGH